MKYFVRTFGCQMNMADSMEYTRHLRNWGFLPTENIEEAGIVLLNTCTVRQHAEDRALSFLGQLKKLKMNPRLNRGEKFSPEANSPPAKKIIIVAGCVAQRLGEDLKRRFPHIDLVVGAKDIDHFPELVNPLLTNSPFVSAGLTHLRESFGGQVNQAPIYTFTEATVGLDKSSPYLTTQPSNHQVTAFVTIMRGCENFCSYCIVPYVRGGEKSRPVEEILSEINCLVKKGVKEVTLLGQNVNSYKSSRTFNPLDTEAHKGLKCHLQGISGSEIDFADLLTEVNKIEGLERIRFVTSHPKDLNEKIIFAMRDLDKVCEHLHLPVQAGSNNILERMNRNYTREDYLRLVEKIKTAIPDIAVTTDIIVGFPGETEEDFKQTLDLVEEVEFDNAFTFKYSVRPGTTASRLWTDDVPLKTKEERLQILNELCKKISQKENQKLIGTKQEVLVEKHNRGKCEGKTRTNKTAFFTAEKDILGQMVTVEIAEARPHSLIGKIYSS